MSWPSIVACTTATIIGFSPTAHAYGSDIHYTVTYALAVAAGWRADDAHVIASSAYAPDSNFATEATVTLGRTGEEARRTALGYLANALIENGQGDFRLVQAMEEGTIPGEDRTLGTELYSGLPTWNLVYSPTNLSLHCLSRVADERVTSAAQEVHDIGLHRRIAALTGEDESDQPGSRRAEDVKQRLGTLLAEVSGLAEAAHTSSARDKPRDERLATIAIGIYLHCQQDSWSHSGWGRMSKYIGHFVEYIHDAAVWAAWTTASAGSATPPAIESSSSADDTLAFEGDRIQKLMDCFEARPESSRNYPQLVLDILQELATHRVGRQVNGDHPAVRPAQLYGAMAESFFTLRELAALFYGPDHALPEVEATDIDLLRQGVSHPSIRRMRPLGTQERESCIRDIAGHWLSRLKTEHDIDADVHSSAPTTDSSVCREILAESSGVAAPARLEMVEVPEPRFPALLVTIVEGRSSPQRAKFGGAEACQRSVLARLPTGPLDVVVDAQDAAPPDSSAGDLLDDGRFHYWAVDFEAMREQVVLDDGRYLSVGDGCHELRCAPSPAPRECARSDAAGS